jgi:hypothetical protein
MTPAARDFMQRLQSLVAGKAPILHQNGACRSLDGANLHKKSSVQTMR